MFDYKVPIIYKKKKGGIIHSSTDINEAYNLLAFKPSIDIKEGVCRIILGCINNEI